MGEEKIRGGVWYYVITILSAGLLAWVPFFHAASALGRRSLWALGSGYVGAAILAFVLIYIGPDETGDAVPWTADVGLALLLFTMVVGVVQQRGLRRQVYGPHRQVSSRLDPAVQGAQQARERRGEARELAERDPQMARELRIGRPDLPRQYDDGGLVDLNSAPADSIAEVCGISPSVAQALLATRVQLGRFTSVEEAIVYANLPDDAVPGVRERAMVYPAPPPSPSV